MLSEKACNDMVSSLTVYCSISENRYSGKGRG
jgi:hypothetical protein